MVLSFDILFKIPYIFITIIVIYILILVVLMLVEKLIKRKAKVEKVNQKRVYMEALKRIELSTRPPEVLVTDLNRLAQSFFREGLHMQEQREYSELAEIFKKSRKYELESFCNEMILLSYGGEKITRDKVMSAVKILQGIVSATDWEEKSS